MKISETKKGSVGQTGKVKSSDSAKKTDHAGDIQSGEVRKAGVSVSSSGVAGSLSSDADKRAEKVAQIKLDVDNGNYEPDSAQTAAKMLQDLTDYSLA